MLKLHGSAFAAMDALSCIINRRGDSQAGRRGFEPRLPLHLFNSLHEPASPCALFVLRLHHSQVLLQANWLTAASLLSTGDCV